MAGERKVARAVLRSHGQTFAEEIGLRVERGTPAVLFGLLCASLLMSARIGHEISMAAARGVVRRWSTARKLDASTWEQRVRVLNEAGYTRYQERTATMLGDTAAAARPGGWGCRATPRRSPSWSRAPSCRGWWRGSCASASTTTSTRSARRP